MNALVNRGVQEGSGWRPARWYLHQLFSADGVTVASSIRQRRLAACRRDLGDPAHVSRPVAAIASHWGFASAAHFSRVFKTTYGTPPQEYRRAILLLE